MDKISKLYGEKISKMIRSFLQADIINVEIDDDDIIVETKKGKYIIEDNSQYYFKFTKIKVLVIQD